MKLNIRLLLAVLVFAILVNANAAFAQSSNAYIEYAIPNSVPAKASIESFVWEITDAYASPIAVSANSEYQLATEGHWAYIRVFNPYEANGQFYGYIKVIKATSPSGSVTNFIKDYTSFEYYNQKKIKNLDPGVGQYGYIKLSLPAGLTEYETGVWTWTIALYEDTSGGLGNSYTTDPVDEKNIMLEVVNDGFPGPKTLGTMEVMDLGLSADESNYIEGLEFVQDTIEKLIEQGYTNVVEGTAPKLFTLNYFFQYVGIVQNAAKSARETAEAHVDELDNGDGTLTLKVKWRNVKVLSGNIIPPVYGLKYDRAVAFVQIPTSVNIVDSDGADFQSPLTLDDGSTINQLTYVYDYNDQKLEPVTIIDGPWQEINIKVAKEAVPYEVKGDVSLQLGPFKKFDPNAIGYLDTPWASSVRRYDVWQNNPESTVWYTVGQRYFSEYVDAVSVDNPPTLSVSAPSTINVGQSITITTTASDDNKVDAININVDGVITICPNINSQSGTCQYTKTYTSAGTHTYYAVASDNSGQTTRNPVSGERSFQVADAGMPTVAVDAYPNPIEVNKPLHLKATASDDIALRYIGILVDGQIYDGCDNLNKQSSICEPAEIQFSTTGAHTYQAVARDYSGNEGWTGLQSFSVVSEGQGGPGLVPIVTSSISSNKVQVGQPLTISASAISSDPIAKIWIRASIEPNFDPIVVNDCASSSCAFTNSYSIPGVYHYFIEAQTTRGYNGRDPTTDIGHHYSFEVVPTPPPDNPPTASVSANPNSVNQGQTVTISATANDDNQLLQIEIFVDGVSTRACPVSGTTGTCSYASSSFASGTHTYYAIATDNAGKPARDPATGTKSFTVTAKSYIIINITTPRVSVFAWPNPVQTEQNIKIIAGANDNVAVSAIDIFVDDVVQTGTTCTGIGTTSAICYKDLTFGSAGTHTYYSIATDSASNTARGPASGTKSFTVTGTGSITPETPRQWFIMKDMLVPRADLAAVAFNGKIWAIGGRSSNGALSDVEIYDPSSNMWSTGVSLPAPVGTATAVVAYNKIYVINGDTGKVYEYYPVTDQWYEKNAMPINPNGQIAAEIYNNIIYVAGGVGNPWLYAYDPAADAWVQKATLNAPTSRSVQSIGLLNGKLYLIGGNEAGHQPSEIWRVDVYDIQTNTWQLDGIASLPKGLTHLGPTLPVLNNKIYIIGGWNGDIAGPNVQDKVYAYNFSDNKWYEEDPLNVKRFELAYASLDNEIYAIGGMTPSWPAASYHPTNERFASDTTKPTVSVSAPSTINVGQSITITASANDNLQVGTIAIFVDGAQANNCTINAASGSCAYSNSYGSAGTHTYYALAVDRAGNLARYPITGARSFTVAAADTEAPTLTVLHKPASPKIGDNITMTATATDDVDISNVSLYIDEILKSSGPSWCARTLGYWNCTYPITYNTTGTHYYYAIATDTSGNSARDPISGAKSFSVVAQDATPPNVNVSHSLVAFPIATFSARAADDVGVSEINIYLDSSLINSCAVSGTYATCSAFVPAISSGSHAYYATAIDGSGKTGTSEIKEFYAGDQPTVTNNDAPIIYVLNQTNYTLTNKQNWTVEYYFTDADNYTATCSIIANSSSTGGIVTNNTLDSFTFALLDGINYWHISCSDGANSAASGIYVLTKSSTTNSSSGNNTTGGTTGGSSGSAGSGGGGGGGGGGSSSSSKKATANKQTSATAQQTSGPAYPAPQSAPALIEQTGATEGTSAKNTAVKGAAPTGFIALTSGSNSLKALVGVVIVGGILGAYYVSTQSNKLKDRFLKKRKAKK